MKHITINDDLYQLIERTVEHLNENSKQYYHIKVNDFIRIAIKREIHRQQQIKETE